MSASNPRATSRAIVCQVMEDEITALVAARGGIDVVLVEQGLHNEPDRLRARLQSEIDQADADPAIERVILVYGLCGRGTIGLHARRVPVIVPRAHDCIELLVGCPARARQLRAEQPTSYWYSVGWNRHGNPPCQRRMDVTRQQYIDAYGKDNADFLMEQMEHWTQHYDRAVFLDPGLGGTEPEIANTRRYASELGWDFAIEPCRADWLRDLLYGPWDDARFLRVPPGQRIGDGHDDQVVKACPLDGPA